MNNENNNAITPLTMQDYALTSRKTEREIRSIMENTLTEVCQDRGRALLTQNVLSNLKTLSVIENEINTFASPHAVKRCEMIVDAYAMGAAAQIAKW